MSKINGFSPPNNDDVNERKIIFENIFKKYGHLRDENDEGFDIDTFIAEAEAENPEKEMDEVEFDEKNIDTEIDAFEDNNLDPDDYKKQMELIKNMRASPQEQFERLTYWFEADFINKLKTLYEARVKELEQSDLPFFNFRRDETFSEDINQTTDGLSISRKYASTSALSTNSPQVSFIRDPREDNRLLNYARSSSSYSIPMLPNDHIRLPVELSNMMRGHSSFNLRIREYDLSINSNTLKPGLHLAHSYDSIIDSEFKAPLPPPQLNKRQHRSRAIEAPKYQENSSHSSHLRQQSAPPLFHEKSSSVSIEKRQKISIDLSKKSESSKNVKNSTKLTEELTKKLPGSTKLLDDVSENNTLNSKIDAKSSSSCSSKVKADPPVPEKKSQQTKNVKANEKLKTPKMPSCKAPTKTQSSHAAKETPSKLPDKPKEKEPACGANKNNQKTLKGSTNSSQKKTTVMTKAETHEAKSKDPEKIPGSLDPADLITLADVSSAGSSLTTDDDDEWVSGGISRYKERHLSHRIKKLHKRRNEIREKSSELKKKEKSHDTEKELKSKNPPKNESDFSMDKNEMLKETKKDVTVRVEERKKAENRKKFDKVDKKKPDERAKNKKKVYEYYDTDSSD